MGDGPIVSGATRKKCAWPPCPLMVPSTWTHCRNRACQSARFLGNASAPLLTPDMRGFAADLRRARPARAKWLLERKVIDDRRAHQRFLREEREAARRRTIEDRRVERRTQAAKRLSKLIWKPAPPRIIHLDASVSDRHGLSFGDHWNFESDFYSDPTGDAAAARVDMRVDDLPTFLSAAKQCPVVPRDFLQRTMSGELKIVIDDDGPQFVVTRDRCDILPWTGGTTISPTTVIANARGMKHRGGRGHKGHAKASWKGHVSQSAKGRKTKSRA